MEKWQIYTICLSHWIGRMSVMTNYLKPKRSTADLNALIIHEHATNEGDTERTVPFICVYSFWSRIFNFTYFLFVFLGEKYPPLPCWSDVMVARYVTKKNVISMRMKWGMKRCKIQIDNKRLESSHGRIKPRHVIKLPLSHWQTFSFTNGFCIQWIKFIRTPESIHSLHTFCICKTNIVCDTFNFNVLFRSFNRNSTKFSIWIENILRPKHQMKI